MSLATTAPACHARRLVTALSLLAATGAAQALGAGATVDWSALSLELVDTAPDDGVEATFTPIPQYSWTDCQRDGAPCPSPTPPDPTPYPGDTAPLEASGPGYAARAQFVSDRFEASASGALPAAGNLTLTSAFSFAFFVSGPATLTFTLPYTLQLDTAGANARDVSFAEVLLGRAGGTQRVGVDSLSDSAGARNGLLSFTLTAPGPLHTEAFYLHVSSGLRNTGSLIGSPVPEPATAVLMLAGLAGVAGAVRRRGTR